MDSAETAGFFETKNGARTHLTLPLIQLIPGTVTPPAAAEKPMFGGGNGGGENPPTNDRQKDVVVADAKAKYLDVLIKMFEKSLETGAPDEKLMERIERLIGAGT